MVTNERQPPRSLEAEKEVLGSILHKPSIFSEVAGIIRPTDFYDDANGKIFAHFAAIHETGAAVDIALLRDRLQAASDYELIGGAAYLAEIIRSAPTAANAQHYAEIVKRLSDKRRNIEIGTALVQDGYNGKPASRSAAEAIRSLEEVKNSGQQKLSYRRFTCSELAATENETEFYIDGTLVVGQPCIVAGGKKTLKTSLLIDMGISLATAGYFLGKLKVNRGCRVGMMSNESGKSTLGETIRRVSQAAGVPTDSIPGFVLSDQLPRFDSIEHVDALRRFVTEDELEMLILDPAYQLLDTDGDEKSLFAMGKLLRSIGDFCSEVGVTLILAHHTRKSNIDAFRPPELDDIAFAGFAEFARQWLLIGRREKYEPGSGSHRLWLNVGGSAGHSALWAVDVEEGVFDGNTPRHWDVNISRAEEARQDARRRSEGERAESQKQAAETQLQSAKERLINAAAKYPDGETKRVLRDTAGLSGTVADRAISALLSERSLEPCEVKKANKLKPVDGYRIPPDTAN
ncbi:MAG TPA: DnaB-like helicase N-terminal domain-containing protein [Pirellulales bacterium]